MPQRDASLGDGSINKMDASAADATRGTDSGVSDAGDGGFRDASNGG
jgi:hypothetical protein